MGKSTHQLAPPKMGRSPDDGMAAAADDRRTMLTPTVTDIRHGSGYPRATVTALLLKIRNALTPPEWEAGYELVQVSESERQVISDVLRGWPMNSCPDEGPYTR